MIFYGNIQIPRISGNFDACADSVYQALFPRKKGSLGSRLALTSHLSLGVNRLHFISAQVGGTIILSKLQVFFFSAFGY